MKYFNLILLIFIITIIVLKLLNVTSDNINMSSKSENNVEKYRPEIKKFKTTTPSPTEFNKMVLSNLNGDLGSVGFPKGIIVMWSGTISDVPDGWSLCNGANGTPDLRGKFVLGVNSNTDKDANFTTREMGEKGGSETHKLTIGEIPSHWHNFCVGGGGKDIDRSNRNYTKDNGGIKPYGSVGFSGKNGELDGSVIEEPTSNTPMYRGSNDGSGHSNCLYDQPSTYNTGGGKPHNNMPPFYTLAYIMKTV